MLYFAHRLSKVQPSPTLAISAKANELKRQGKAVINMGAGEPDFDAPESAQTAGIEAIQHHFNKYAPIDGYPELKQAIIDKFKRENNLEYGNNQIIVGIGAKQIIYNLCQALLNEGDEAIIPAPYWVSYPAMVDLADGKPIMIETGIEQHFKITPDQLKSAITPKTKLLFLNSPSNPTGMAYSTDELKALGEVLEAHPNIVIISDDIYEHILWTGQPFQNIVNVCPALLDRTLVVNGISKAYAMTGWRIGFAAGPADLIGAMKKIQSHSTSGACSIAQKAAIGALKGDQSCINTMVKAYKERFEFTHQALNNLPGFECAATDGTFYLFPKVTQAMEKLGMDSDVDFASHILEKALIAVVPGSGFGAPGCIRLSIALSMDDLKAAMTRLATLFA